MLVVYAEMFVFSLVFVLAQSFMINSGDYEFQFLCLQCLQYLKYPQNLWYLEYLIYLHYLWYLHYLKYLHYFHHVQ